MNNQEKLLDKLLTDPRFRPWVNHGKHEAYWEKWKEEHPGSEELIKDAKAIVHGLPAYQTGIDPSEIERSFRYLVERAENPVTSTKSRMLRWLPYAAAAVLALFITVWLWFPAKDHQEHNTMVVSTAPGELQEIILPDSSSIMLNGNSSINYSNNSTSGARVAKIEGEVHFHVRTVEDQNGRKPFVVRTEDIDVKVLGTTFSVSVDSIWTTIVLEEGKVSIQNNGEDRKKAKTLVMKPGEKVVYNSAEGNYTLEQIDAAVFNSWTNNQLSLVNRSASEVARWIKRNYNINIHIPGDYRNAPLTGSVDLEDPATAIKVFALALGLKAGKQGEKEWEFKEIEKQ